ncbi:MAG: glutamyl-tRNA amidotransferase [Acidobacteria bacterium RIFCSPHIGHO2_02_FULL_67_57]|nr:MAG: glutamyl-tRNA amidotransferase [Acidobacteria bacterium RIFCSPHIGHO2_02_FULL_67_57]
MSFADRIQKELTAAMKARDELRLLVLRMLKTALENRRIEKRAALDDAEALAVMKTLVKQRHEAAEEFKKGGRADRAAEEEKEIGILEQYLPAAVGEDQIKAAIEEAVKETGAASAKDTGKVMKAVMGRFAGQNVDGKRVNELVRQRLSS